MTALLLKLLVLKTPHLEQMLAFYQTLGVEITEENAEVTVHRREQAMPRKQYDVSPERFVEIWEKASSSKEAAAQLGMPKSIMHARASGYRAQGIKLKKMPRGPRRLDVEGLNRLSEGLRPQQETGDVGSIAF